MSVIITGMDMPDGCFGKSPCPLSNGEYGSCQYSDFIGSDSIETSYEGNGIPKGCPLKSVNGLIEKIQELPNDNPSYWHNCDVVDREKIIDTIKEYCGVGDEPQERSEKE